MFTLTSPSATGLTSRDLNPNKHIPFVTSIPSFILQYILRYKYTQLHPTIYNLHYKYTSPHPTIYPSLQVYLASSYNISFITSIPHPTIYPSLQAYQTSSYNISFITSIPSFILQYILHYKYTSSYIYILHYKYTSPHPTIYNLHYKYTSLPPTIYILHYKYTSSYNIYSSLQEYLVLQYIFFITCIPHPTYIFFITSIPRLILQYITFITSIHPLILIYILHFHFTILKIYLFKSCLYTLTYNEVMKVEPIIPHKMNF